MSDELCAALPAGRCFLAYYTSAVLDDLLVRYPGIMIERSPALLVWHPSCDSAAARNPLKPSLHNVRRIDPLFSLE